MLVLAVSAGLLGCSKTPTSPGAAVLTGYRVASPASGTSGPVSTALSAIQTAALRQAVSGLVARLEGGCQEPLGLIYRLRFPPVPGTRADPLLVTGYRCAADVSIVEDGKTTWYVDRGCVLSQLVRADAPVSASATRTESVGCDGPS